MEEETGKVDSAPELHIEISRTESLGIDVHSISTFKERNVHDYTGRLHTIEDIWNGKPTIIIFVRHFLCYTCEEYMEDLNLVSPDLLEAAGAQLVVIGCAPWRFIKAFRDRLKFRHQLYTDEEKKLYELFKLKQERDIGNPKSSKHIKSGYFSGLLKTTWRAWESMEWQGDPFQQGGALVIDADGRVVFSHKDERASDHCSINALLQQVGVEPVSFPGDPQIKII